MPTTSPEVLETDVAVIGAGAAGLYAALTAAENGASAVLVSATPLAQTASYWAQGGLAAALGPDDTPDLHRQDTETAGRAMVRRTAANLLTRDAPRTVRELEAHGVAFDTDPNGNLSLGLEGGHSVRRVVHAGGSATGRRVVRQLSGLAVQSAGITVLEHVRAAQAWVVDGRCIGAILEDGRAVRARATILATGGAAALWSRTTNPPGSIGIGMMIARDAGAALADLEFVQFHPTAVIGIKGREGFLITEAIRGEGATLHDKNGERFIEELAPRDEVARAIQNVLDRDGVTHVDLDMRKIDPALFPNVVTAMRDSGLDPATQMIPVAPACHYVMGGVAADLDGASTVPGLYVVGETACTGLHGANRLASNSLTECFVLGKRAALAGLDEPRPAARATPPAPVKLEPPSRETRHALWEHAGIIRSPEGLKKLLTVDHELVKLVGTSALAREESRGAHYRTDFPDSKPELDGHHAVIRNGGAPAFEHWL